MTKSIRQYLMICFSVTYLTWGTLAFFSNVMKVTFSEYAWMYVLYVIGVIAPAISAVTVQVRNEEYTFKQALLRIVKPPRKLTDVMLVVILAFLFQVVPFLIYGGQRTTSLINIFVFIPIYFIIGGLEEVGWRGYWLEHIIAETK